MRPNLPRPRLSLPTQAVLLMAAAIVVVAGSFAWLQAEAIRREVLGERLAAVQRSARAITERAEEQRIPGDAAARAAYVHAQMRELATELGAIEITVTDSSSVIVATTREAELGMVEAGEEAHLVQSGRAATVMRPEKGAETQAFAFVIPLQLGPDRGVMHVDQDIVELNRAIATATWQSLIPSILVLLVVAPLAALISRRVLVKAQQAEQERAWLSRFQSVVQNAFDVILITDRDGRVRYASPSSERVLGFEAADLEGSAFVELVHLDEAPSALAALTGIADGRVAQLEHRLRHHDGHWLTADIQAANLLNDPGVGGIVLTIRDVTDRKTLEAQLTHQALHDPLTGLPNRALFHDRVRHAVARAQRAGTGLAIFFIDLDDFKAVNDTLGHGAGDAVLAQVAARLVESVRQGDTAARLGGDEFGVVLEDVGADEVTVVAERVLEAIQLPFEFDGRTAIIGATIGIAGPDAVPADAAELVRSADVAMYAAKDAGKGRFLVFEPGMRLAGSERAELAAELAEALELDQFEVYYQPIVDVVGGAIASLEALVRWRHPERGLIPPAEFIPLAERTGLIVSLGDRVLEEACRQTRAWHLDMPSDEPVGISVNLSPVQLQDPGLSERVQGILASTALAPRHLTLEITESVLMHDTEATTARLQELKALGIRLAIDDFGTGYSSLSYLRRFPVDVIKIDKSFVDGLTNAGPATALARSIVKLAHNLQLTTVAEGVEQRQQLVRLTGMGCDLAQGYLFAKPLDAPGATALLLARSEGVASAV